ncbi:hypothetical protein C6P45_005259 [Maudiozyma exigua]|uniref:Uncharacterized protein n=1 Tax=Maudiozyma exigua TaxID=34358 RepID=A0A9P7B9C3_MAUEX|nr:hypothetical protein C6P45_005259 [Kazachstania exigua]
MIRRRIFRYRRIVQQETRFSSLIYKGAVNRTCLYHTSHLTRTPIPADTPNGDQIPKESSFNHSSVIPNKFTNVNKIQINDKNEELAKWIRNSYIETSLTFLAPRQGQNNLLNDSLNLDATGAGYIGGIPAVDEDTFNIIWKFKFCIGDPQVVNIVLKRIHNRRTIFNVKQLNLLLMALRELKRDTQIHRIYAGYEKFLKYFLEDNSNDVDREDIDLLLEMFMSVERRLSNYNNCEKLFSYYIKYSRIKSEFTLLGLRSFIENSNLQLAKEFFMQVLSNKDTFPLSSRDFFKLLCFLNTVRNYKTMNHFYQLWLFNRPEEINNSVDSINISALMYRTYMLSRDEEKIKTFLENDTIKKSGFVDSIKFELTNFYDKIFELRKTEINNLVTIEMPHVMKQQIENFSKRLSDDIKERRLFYLTLLRAYTRLNNIKEIKNLLEIVDKDDEIELDFSFHSYIVAYFVKNGQLNNLIDYYNELLKRNAPICERRTFIALYKCFNNRSGLMSQEYKNEMMIVLKSNPNYEHAFPWIKNVHKYWIDKRGLCSFDATTYNQVKVALKTGDLIEAKTLLISRCRDGVMPQVQMFYNLLRLCLESDYINLATMIEQMIKDMYHPNNHMTMKIQLLLLKQHLLLSPSNGASKKKAIYLLENQFRSSSPSFQNLLQLADIYSGIHDSDNGDRLLDQSYREMNKTDKKEWLMYYKTSLKLYCKAADWEQFIATLRQWNDDSNASYLEVDTLKSVRQYVKFMQKEHTIKEKKLLEEGKESFSIDAYMQEISKELRRLGQRYGINKINTLNDMNTVSTFLKRFLKLKYDCIIDEYMVKQKELIEKYKQFQ